MLRTRALPDCRPLLAFPDELTLVFQPIVDLSAATVAGYEALARFPGTAGPDVWFAAAAEAGPAAELEALAIHKALATVPDLPANTFLSVDVSPRTGSSRRSPATRPPTTGSPTSPPSWCRRCATASSPSDLHSPERSARERPRAPLLCVRG